MTSALRAMRQKGAERGRHDDGNRGADAKLHAHVFRHAEHAKHLVEHRHDDRAAADAEQAGEHAGDDAADEDHKHEPGGFRASRRRGTSFCIALAGDFASGRDSRRFADRRSRDQRERATKNIGARARLHPGAGEVPAEGARAGHGAEQSLQVAGDRHEPRALAPARARYRG